MNPFPRSFRFTFGPGTKRFLQTTALVALALSSGRADAATASFSTTAPAVGANDVSQLTGHVTAGSNANQKKSNAGGGDDNSVYLDSGRPAQGQTFRTGSNPNGYQVTAVTLKQVAYNTYAAVPDITYHIRVTLPSGSTLTVLAEETAVVAADEDRKSVV